MDDIDLLFLKDGEWRAADQLGAVVESDLQAIIAGNPRLIPNLGTEPVAVRELHSDAGPLDVVVVDREGSVTLVEVKRHSNFQARREIVGQALDYAGRLWEMPIDSFKSAWSKAGGIELEEHLDDEAMASLADALEAGRFRIVLAVDILNESMTRIVDYLNQHTNDSLTVMAMEFRYWKQGDVEILLPRLHGDEAALAKENRARVERGQQRWTREAAALWLSDHRPGEAVELLSVVDDLYALAGVDVVWTSSRTPSLVTEIRVGDGKLSYPMRLELGRGPHGVLEIHFRWMSTVRDAVRDDFLGLLSAVPAFGLDAGAIRAAEFRKRPVIGLDTLQDRAARHAVMSALTLIVGS